MSIIISGKRKPETEAKYSVALQLYQTTNLTTREICRQTNTSLSGFKRYLYCNHRELIFARHKIYLTSEEAQNTKLRESKGQTAAARAKYGEAIWACEDKEYIEYNVSQIAQIFHLSPSGLGQQLRSHYPEIIERREQERRKLGINDNLHRGSRPWCIEQYGDAIEHLRNSEDTIQQTANLFNISFTGLRGHLLYYHKDLVKRREDRRQRSKGIKQIGYITGNGTRHLPSSEQVEKYVEAIYLYRTTALTMKEIVRITGVTLNGFRNYLRVWHAGLMLERRGISSNDKNATLSNSKHYLKSTAVKYAKAIEYLKSSGCNTTEVAKRFGLHPETFRGYLYEHEPELAASLGMKRLDNGKLVLSRSADKYEDAIKIYETTTESLKSIARRLDIKYNSIGGFIRRNYPNIIICHNRLVEEGLKERQKQELLKAEQQERQRIDDEIRQILDALKQSRGNCRQAARQLGVCKSTLYNKLKLYNIKYKLR